MSELKCEILTNEWTGFPLRERFTFDGQLEHGERVSQIFANTRKKVSGKQRDLYSTLMFPANLLNLILNLVYGDTLTCTWNAALDARE